jgi:hypothetical protein
MNNKLSKDVLKKIGNISQIAPVRRVEFLSGKAKDTQAYEVLNAAGLYFNILIDKCMDIFDFKYKGINIGFATKNGMTSNRFFNAIDNEFLYYWDAGMLYTCGLANVGPSCVDEGLYRTEHGRIGMMPADNISVDIGFKDDTCLIKISGEMNESIVYGSNLKLMRTISTDLYSKEITIKDVVKNMEPKEEEFMLLYHFNFGYPLLDDGAVIIKPEGEIYPRTSENKEDIRECFNITGPIDDCDEKCFFHENRFNKDGWAYVGLINQKLKLGAYLKYKMENLPVLLEWKSMRSHDYAVGLELSNCYVMGRYKERENKTLKKIRGYSQIKYEVRLGILDGEKEISRFSEKISLM